MMSYDFLLYHITSHDVSNSRLGNIPKIGNQGEYKFVERLFLAHFSKMVLPKKKSEKKTARIQTNAKKSAEVVEEAEAREESDESSDGAADLTKLHKADLLAQAVATAAELADLKKAAKNRGKSSIVGDDDVINADGITSEEEPEGGKRKRRSPRKSKQPAPSKLGERVKKILERTKTESSVDPEYELWKISRAAAAVAIPTTLAVVAPLETAEAIAKCVCVWGGGDLLFLFSNFIFSTGGAISPSTPAWYS